MLADAVPEKVAPGVGECPERRRHVRAHRRALRPRRTFAPATVHLLAHFGIHLVERVIADTLLAGHSRLLGAKSTTSVYLVGYLKIRLSCGTNTSRPRTISMTRTNGKAPTKI